MTINLFELATRQKFTFPSPSGNLSVEQLWDLPLVALRPDGSVREGALSLDTVARAVNSELQKASQESFVPLPDKTSSAAETLSQKLDIVKHIIGVKVAERDAQTLKKKVEERKKQIRTLLAKKDLEALEVKSQDELLKELEALD